MEKAEEKSGAIGHRSHGFCVACGAANPAGLKLKFRKEPDGSVRAAVFCRREVTGYDGLLHGGVAALMLDSAMTNCLFALGIAAFTAELNIKYKAPVAVGRAAEVSARLVSDMDPLYVLKAELKQDGAVKVLADAKFMRNAF
jgi:acyl-coenzyme A thioesterase PaaI-like protein